MLAVVANIDDAKRYVDHLKTRGIKAAIATSDDSALATRNINKFKEIDTKSSVGCLVTVAMAYEGLDVPPITHIACLTHIRSKPWIEQMIARATRFDAPAGDWEEQMAYIYVPDDRLICNIIGRMQDEQLVAIKARLEEDELAERAERMLPDPSERRTITPVGSGALTRRWSRVGAAEKSESSGDDLEKRTPSQVEAELRERIQDYCKNVDALFFGRQWGETNKRVVKTFSQSRQHMPLEKLQRVLVWLEEYYPLGSMSRK
jgi:superfamily II DNA or RNA helicase